MQYAHEALFSQRIGPAALAGRNGEFIWLLRVPRAQISEAKTLITKGVLAQQLQLPKNAPPGRHLSEILRRSWCFVGWLKIVSELNNPLGGRALVGGWIH